MPDADETMTAAVVYTTGPDVDTLSSLARRLLDQNLIACANILPGMRAVYRWEGKVESAAECAMILKTTRDKVDTVIREIEVRHPYDTPAALVLPVVAGSAAFLEWIARETASPSRDRR